MSKTEKGKVASFQFTLITSKNISETESLTDWGQHDYNQSMTNVEPSYKTIAVYCKKSGY